ncbi:hypothetical protein DM860_013537 [Cuscuta australis]|uniref:Uncharacterized protein n=1 Tax=Cuscuta australis TaxID=267555 RepID=A0A328EEN4_9ASTE|nr:hypothetical protein DM860_013537 [Cuscuta australis]
MWAPRNANTYKTLAYTERKHKYTRTAGAGEQPPGEAAPPIRVAAGNAGSTAGGGGKKVSIFLGHPLPLRTPYGPHRSSGPANPMAPTWRVDSEISQRSELYSDPTR